MSTAASDPQPHADFLFEILEQYTGSLSSPFRRNGNSTRKHQVPQKLDFKAARSKKAEEMLGFFVGPMPVQAFLDSYVAEAQEPTPPLPQLFQSGSKIKEEKAMYSEFIQKITASGLIPGFKIVDTSEHPDLYSLKGRRFKPDPSMYRESVNTEKRPTQFDELELNFEFKRGSGFDPFQDPEDDDEDTAQEPIEDETPEKSHKDTKAEKRKALHFEALTAGGKDVRGQLTLYATEWFARQPRLFGFTVFIFHPYVRFILWDRSASVVTERFDLGAHPEYLAEFLWRFVHLSDFARGRDPSVRKATEEEARLAKEHLSEWKEASERPVYVFSVPDGQLEREFIGWGSLALPESLIGRATKAYPVYEMATGKRYFLKDSWRAVTTEKEATILQELNAAGVRNVPRLVCGGDLREHRTLSHLVGVEEDSDFYDSETGLKRPEWKCGQYFVIERIHHRFVEDFIGTHLEHFRSSKQLMQAVYDAFIAHEDAVTKCRILHRDVSGKNVMMTQNGHGILNDWDLAKRIPEFPDVEQPRTPHRTGTWQFISAMLLKRPGKRHVVQDDIESFIYVVLYYAFRYLPHSAVDCAKTLFAEVFDESSKGASGQIEGGKHKTLFFKMPDDYLGDDFEFTSNAPLQSWFEYILRAVEEWHRYEYQLLHHIRPPKPSTIPRNEQDSPERLVSKESLIPFGKLEFADHSKLRKRWEAILALSNWPEHEILEDHTPEQSPEPQPKPVDHASLGSRFGSASGLPKRPLEGDLGGEQMTKRSRTSTSLHFSR